MTDGMQESNGKENIFPGFSVKTPLIIGKTEEKECLKSCGNTALFIYRTIPEHLNPVCGGIDMFISLSVISI